MKSYKQTQLMIFLIVLFSFYSNLLLAQSTKYNLEKIDFITYQVSKIDTMIAKKQYGEIQSFGWSKNDDPKGVTTEVSGSVDFYFQNGVLRKTILNSEPGGTISLKEEYFYNANGVLILFKKTDDFHQTIYFFDNNKFILGAIANVNFHQVDKTSIRLVKETYKIKKQCQKYKKKSVNLYRIMKNILDIS